MFISLWPQLIEQARIGNTAIELTPIVREALKKYGRLGAAIAIEYLEIFAQSLRLNPHSVQRYVKWGYALSLDDLFVGTDSAPEVGVFIDQRYINFLHKNPEKLAAMHWRKFEELTSEFFVKEGCRVAERCERRRFNP